MAYVEISKAGKLVRRRAVSDEKARQGCRIRLGQEQEVRLRLGESATIGEFHVRVVEDGQPPAQDRPAQAGAGDGPPGPAVAASPPADRALPASESFPQVEGYEITSRLGEGGMGTVWKAVQLSTRRVVALKLLSDERFGSARARARFEREVELSAKLEHPNIARVYDSGVNRGVYYYALEFIEGQHLDQFVRGQKLGPRQILELMGKVCQAVQFAHQRGVIHRDLKPSNIMVTADGQPHVLDFGLAKAVEDEQEHQLTISIEGEVAGTPAYMSPEQAAGRIDQIDTRSDVYSLGVILFQLLTGEYPHETSGTRYELIRRIVEQDARRPRQVNPSIDREVESLLLKALARDPKDRYPLAGRLAQDIANYLAGEPLNAHASTTTYRLTKKVLKHRWAVAGGLGGLAVVAIAAVLVGLWIAGERRQAQRDRDSVAARHARELADQRRSEAERVRSARLRVAVNATPAQQPSPATTTPSGQKADLYVHATQGSDIDGDGTRARPWKTIQRALDGAAGTAGVPVRIHVAAGNYLGPVVLGDRNSYVSLLGGYSASDWSDRRPENPDDRDNPKYRTCITGDTNGDGNAEVRCVFYNRCPNAGLLSGLVIEKGSPLADPKPLRGGGIFSFRSSPTLTHVTVANCSAENGGGLCSLEGSPTLTDCLFTDNNAATGGGVQIEGETGRLERCIFRGNSCSWLGQGFYAVGGSKVQVRNCLFSRNTGAGAGAGCCDKSSVTFFMCEFIGNETPECGAGLYTTAHSETRVLNCVFAGNVSRSVFGGGAISGGERSLEVVNCTFYANKSATRGGGICLSHNAVYAIRNCILWGNTAPEGPQIATFNKDAAATVTFCCIEGGREKLKIGDGAHVEWGQGNIDADPLFASSKGWNGGRWDGDYHLKSVFGRWTPAGWVHDTLSSPCIGAGDPASACDEEPAPNGGRIEIGAYGNTLFASKSVRQPSGSPTTRTDSFERAPASQPAGPKTGARVLGRTPEEIAARRPSCGALALEPTSR